MDRYEHRQRGPWLWLFGAPGVALVCAALWFAVLGMLADPAALPCLGLSGLLLLLAGASMAWLDVRDDGESLVVRFAPLGLFGTTIPYEAIESVERMRTSLFVHGLGMHGIPGWFAVLNTWGMDAVRIRLKRRHGLTRVRTIIIGTDDPEGLAAFLTARIEGPQGEP
jgi:hypothetical protein